MRRLACLPSHGFLPSLHVTCLQSDLPLTVGASPLNSRRWDGRRPSGFMSLYSLVNAWGNWREAASYFPSCAVVGHEDRALRSRKSTVALATIANRRFLSALLGGAGVGGNVRIGSGVAMGTNAIIHPDKSVGDDAIVGIGGVVIRSVKPGVTVFGNPAETNSCQPAVRVVEVRRYVARVGREAGSSLEFLGR